MGTGPGTRRADGAGLGHAGGVFLLLPLVLAGPALGLADVVVRLSRYGPLGWGAAAALLVALSWSSRALLSAVRTWWASTA